MATFALLTLAIQNLHNRHIGRPISWCQSTHPRAAFSAWATRGPSDHTELPKMVGTIPTYSVYGTIARLLRASQEMGLVLMARKRPQWVRFAGTRPMKSYHHKPCSLCSAHLARITRCKFLQPLRYLCQFIYLTTVKRVLRNSFDLNYLRKMCGTWVVGADIQDHL